jgi:mono/diheme cytochrome c family protein
LTKNRLNRLAAAALFSAAAFSAAQSQEAPGVGTPGVATPGATIFATRCAVCHGPAAAGIPGTFPSLREQIIAFAKSPAGRDYLVMVVSSGLMGELSVASVHYNNVMPAQSGLSEADVAAVLNYLASDLGKQDLGSTALSANDVTDARARHPQNTAQGTRALRPAG